MKLIALFLFPELKSPKSLSNHIEENPFIVKFVELNFHSIPISKFPSKHILERKVFIGKSVELAFHKIHISKQMQALTGEKSFHCETSDAAFS